MRTQETNNKEQHTNGPRHRESGNNMTELAPSLTNVSPPHTTPHGWIWLVPRNLLRLLFSLSVFCCVWPQAPRSKSVGKSGGLDLPTLHQNEWFGKPRVFFFFFFFFACADADAGTAHTHTHTHTHTIALLPLLTQHTHHHPATQTRLLCSGNRQPQHQYGSGKCVVVWGREKGGRKKDLHCSLVILASFTITAFHVLLQRQSLCM